MQPQLDYIASIQFMWYQQECIPRQVVLAGIYDSSDVYSVQPCVNSLKGFSYTDVLKNLDIPYNPWDPIPEVGTTIHVPINELASFLGNEFYETLLKSDSGWDVHIGTLDMASFLYLQRLLPDEKIHFVGSEIMKNCFDLMGPKPDVVRISKMAARNLKSLCNRHDQGWTS